MKHQDISDKVTTQAGSSISQEAMQMSNQIADLMREKCTTNSNVNVFVLGFPKDDIISYDAAAKTEAQSGKPSANDVVTYKEGAQSLKEIAAKKESLMSEKSTADGYDMLVKKDEKGNVIKFVGDGGNKSPMYSKTPQKFI